MKFRVRCNLWQVEADSIQDAKKLACDIMRNMPSYFLSIEVMEKPKHWLLRLFLLGH